MTLLELLLVVLILSSVAWMSLAVVSNDADQVRYEDTRNRLNAIRKAIIGSSSPAAWENGILGGFVVDNGRLPGNIDALVARPTGYDTFGRVSPVFDSNPDGNGINDGAGETVLTLPQQQLMKGHRLFYLIGRSNEGEYRDGWGTDRSAEGGPSMDCPTSPSGAGANLGNDLDADNHGWCVTMLNGNMYVDSYGMDGRSGASTGNLYERDMPMSEPILSDDWQTDVAGRSIRVVNESGNDIGLDALGTLGVKLRASLLVYINDGNEDNVQNSFSWRRWTSDPTLEGDACLDGDGDGLCNGVPAPSETTATFPTTVSIPIPVGEHLLVLVVDDDGIAENADDTPDLSIAGVGSAKYATSRVKFFSRGGTPDMVLRIR
jgi:hypothetical protein